MIAYKGRFSAKQYIPSKPIKWGIKVCISNIICMENEMVNRYKHALNPKMYFCLLICLIVISR
jgi:hypothetical protein